MSEHPEIPEECPICNRVETKIRNSGLINGRLSEEEIEELIKEVQSSILNKEIIKTRGIKMTIDETYVLNKTSFNDFYETQGNLVRIMDKVVDHQAMVDEAVNRIELQLAKVIAKAFPELDGEGEGFREEEVEIEGEDDGENIEAELGAEEEEEEEEEEEMPEEDMEAEKSVPLDVKNAASDEKAFRAGFEAAIEQMKKSGMPVDLNPKVASPKTPVSSSDARNAVAANNSNDLNKGLTDAQLARMTPAQLNAMLNEQAKTQRA